MLRRNRVASWANARLKCLQVRRQYQRLCRRYGSRSVISDGAAVAQLGHELWQAGRRYGPPNPGARKPRVLFVGTDLQQDQSGTIQALDHLSELTLFEQEPGSYGQRWPTSTEDVESVRAHNAARLVHYLDSREPSGRLDAIVGQMWGLSLHWRALTEARRRGIAVVNVSMDDRHAFMGRRLADGTHGGTLGLVPYVSLACTAAPECVRWYEAEGCRAMFLPEASDPEVFRPLNVSKTYDVCFVGANYGVRAQMVRALESSGVKVEAYGSGWPNGRLPAGEVPRLFASSRIVLGCGTVGHCAKFVALKLRDFDGPMSGSLYLTHENPDLRPLYEVGSEIGTFLDLEEMVVKVRHYLAHPDECETVARAGRARAIQDHTWLQRFRWVFHTLWLGEGPDAARA